ncbi:hypothetical protein K439DRAFT_1359683 [Ramaria rubella]|nr:hypothetical protein K439DRAFT_1359683 [Ramaria rubella]
MSQSQRKEANPETLSSIKPTVIEIRAGRLTPQHIQHALEALHEDGMVMIDGAIPQHDQIDKLNEHMVNDALVLRDSPQMPFNYNKGNIQQNPPLTPALFFPSVFFNPLAIQVTNAFLGPRPKMTFHSANTALKATEGQPVHTDADFAHPKIPFALVVNTGLVDMKPQNGSTEVWLGTHLMASLAAQEGMHGERASGRIKAPLLDARRSIRPPIQPHVPKGAILIRDLRLWHCGRPNMTDIPRVMLAQIHFAPWYRNPMRLELPRELQPILESLSDLEVPADFIEGPVDHLGVVKYGNAYDFGQID